MVKSRLKDGEKTEIAQFCLKEQSNLLQRHEIRRARRENPWLKGEQTAQACENAW